MGVLKAEKEGMPGLYRIVDDNRRVVATVGLCAKSRFWIRI